MSNESAWQQSWRRRTEVALIAGVGYPLLRALGSTWRWTVGGAEHLEGVGAAGFQPILACWHGRILPGTIHLQRRGIVVIVSENYDGEWIARIIQKFGFGTARGSTSRGGPKALRQLVRAVRSNGVAMTVDGPRGPALVAQAGAVWLSKATGNPIVPFHCEAAASWTVNSWDRTQLPKPFTTVAIAFAAPLFVPRDADTEALEDWRRRLESSLDACRQHCLEMLATPHPRTSAPSHPGTPAL